MKAELIITETPEPKETPEGQQTFFTSEEFIRMFEDRGRKDTADAFRKVIEVCERIKEAGGRALLVGGSVRDMVLGIIPKDFDLEVYGLTRPQIEAVIRQFGKISDVGASFKALKIACGGGLEIDVTQPRRDSKVAVGHGGFEVEADPDMTPVEAARRRDFTMNSMMYDPLTGELNDPFGGLADLRARRLRVIDPAHFGDDPLRVLRALQFVGRMGLIIDDPKTIKVIKEALSELHTLPTSRFLEEWRKLLLKSPRPSLGLVEGLRLGVYGEVNPEFPGLTSRTGEPSEHLAGDAWMHTLIATDEAARITRRENLSEDNSWLITLAALCHDFGEPKQPEVKNGRFVIVEDLSDESEQFAHFMDSVGVDKATRRKVAKIINNFHLPTVFYQAEFEAKDKIKVRDGDIRRLAKRIAPATIRELLLAAEIVQTARDFLPDISPAGQYLLRFGYPARAWLLGRAEALGVADGLPKDLIRGEYLRIELKYKPGPDFGKIIRLVNELRDEKDFSEEDVKRLLADAKTTKEAIDKLNQALAN